MACSNKKIRAMLKYWTWEYQPNPDLDIRQIKSGNSVDDFVKDTVLQDRLRVDVKISKAASGCGNSPWPDKWETMKIKNLAERINGGA